MTLKTHLNGALFAEHREGHQPVVLALHGWGRDRSDLLAALGGRDLVSMDLPGFGASPPPPKPWGASEYAMTVAKACVEIGRGPYLVVGHSFGGRVAVQLAADRPELVSGVVFVGVPLLRAPHPAQPRLSYRIARAVARAGLLPDRAMEAMRRRYGSADYRAATGVMRDVLVRVVNEEYREQLVRIRCPVGFCWGADDSAVPLAVASEAATFVASTVIFEVVENAGHDVHLEAPARLASVVDAVENAVP